MDVTQVLENTLSPGNAASCHLRQRTVGSVHADSNLDHATRTNAENQLSQAAEQDFVRLANLTIMEGPPT